MPDEPFLLSRFPVHLGLGATVVLEAGEATINPPGVWHTGWVDGHASAFFVTAGVGTEIRGR
jgi:hypothetical protein